MEKKTGEDLLSFNDAATRSAVKTSPSARSLLPERAVGLMVEDEWGLDGEETVRSDQRGTCENHQKPCGIRRGSRKGQKTTRRRRRTTSVFVRYGWMKGDVWADVAGTVDQARRLVQAGKGDK